MSERISSLPQWRDQALSTTAPRRPSARPSVVPVHPCLVDIYQHLDRDTPDQDSGFTSRSLPAPDGVTEICEKHYRDFTNSDFAFVLETIQKYTTSQQQFWDSMAVLIRRSTPHFRRAYSDANRDWKSSIFNTMLPVVWTKNISFFVEQIERLRNGSSGAGTDSVIPALENTGQGTREVEPQQDEDQRRRAIDEANASRVASTMVEGLLSKFYGNQALWLYEILSEQGISMPGFIGDFIRIAVAEKDGSLLERIGSLLLKHEDDYHAAQSPDSTETRPRNRPLLMSAKLMDSFVHGACEQERFDIARAVFDRGLQAGQKYRATTFTRILNSYSVKDFGFDIVKASMERTLEEKRSHHGRGQRLDERGTQTTSWSPRTSDPAVDTGKADRLSMLAGTKMISVAAPETIETYVQAMEDAGVNPTTTTLNVLAKLYLEMAQYRVPGAPPWKYAFKRYNPLELEPDVVTKNTLLAYCEKHKDLDTMRRIYDGMAGVPEVSARNSKRIRKKPWVMQAENNQSGDYGKGAESSDAEGPRHMVPQPSVSRVRSKRDIYTYNTMLHALLQHAVESKDIAAIGQCFHDMELDGIAADTVTFNTNILYHIRRGDFDSAVQVFRSMKGSPEQATTMKWPPVVSNPWTLDPLAGQGPANVVRPSSMRIRSIPTALSSKGNSSTAVAADATSRPLDDNVATHLSSPPKPASADLVPSPAPDVATLTSLISGFGRAGQMDKAVYFFNQMTERHQINPNLKTYLTLVDGLHRTGDHEGADRLWEIILEEETTGSTNQGIDSDSMEASEEILDDEEALLRFHERRQGQGAGRSDKHLTIMERLEAETRRKLYRESIKE
ncbi:hypothetical protein BG011_008280 [Mortierella polycephala]|uniref:Pentatricopeptide repeat-containing protein n=1 Tax=Mortierella polycephala TaxID=41804 RepID=A0A9P6TXA4_9FUNG|nr:hypothetical protein BG011_008280 [Mortierella polycephala]